MSTFVSSVTPRRWAARTWDRLLQWGATPAEAARALPGDALLVEGRASTNALTIAAPPEQVWPWIAQIGRGRGGFYTYTWIENLLGADIHNLDRVDPALQRLAPGDRIWLTPPRYLGQPGQFWTVRDVSPGWYLVADQRPPDNPTAGTWVLVLEPVAGGTRLLNRHRSVPPKSRGLRIWAAFMTLGNVVMERGMLRGIARRAETAVAGGRRSASRE